MPIDPPTVTPQVPRILVAVDGSNKDGPALKWALSAAKAFGATVVDVIHALGLKDSSHHSTGTGETVRAHAEQACRQALQTVIDTAAPLADAASIQLRIEPGHPVLLLLREIERTNPDLVVLGRSPAHSGTATLGSVSREIASKSPVPVVVVPFA
jgi:nucleotide-binding universal stress UspA family protein